MPDFRQNYEVTANVANFVSNINQGKKAAAGFEGQISSTDDTVVNFNEKLNRFTGARGIISNQEALNRVGVITERQFNRVNRVFDELIQRNQSDSIATAQLTRLKRSFAAAVGQVTEATQRSNVAKQNALTITERLNARGIQTTQQLNAELREIQELIIAHEGDRNAVAGLIIQKERLEEQIRTLDVATRNQARSTKLSQFALLNVGFTIQDLSTLSQGWAFALRAVANNIDITTRTIGQLIQESGGFRNAFKQLGRDLLTPGGLVVGLNLLTTAAIIAFSVFEKEGKEVQKFAESLDSAADAVIKLTESFQDTQEFDLQGLEEGLAAAEDALEGIEEYEAGLRRAFVRTASAGQQSAAAFAGVTQASKEALAALEAQLEPLEEERAAIEDIIEQQRELIVQEKARQRINEQLERLQLSGVSRLDSTLNSLRNQNQELQRTLQSLEGPGALAIAFAEQSIELNERDIELRKEAAALDARQFRQAEELQQVRIEAAQDVRRSILDEAEALEALVQTLRSYNAGAARTLATLERRVALQERDIDLVLAAESAEQRRLTLSRELAQARRAAMIALTEDQSALQVEAEEIRAQIQFWETSAGLVTAQYEAQNRRLERQLNLIRQIRQAQVDPQRVEPRGQDRLTDEERQRLDPFRGQTLVERLRGEDGNPLRQDPRDGRIEGDLRDLFAAVTGQARQLSETVINEFGEIERGGFQLGDQLSFAWDAWLSGATDALVDFSEEALNRFEDIGGGIASNFASTFETNFRLAQTRANEALRNGNAALAAESKRQAERNLRNFKTFAIAEALINTFTAATRALREGPIVGPILAASITAAGLAQVRAIRRTRANFGTAAAAPRSFRAAQPVEFFRDGLSQPARPSSGIIASSNAAASAAMGTVDVNLRVTPGVLPSGDVVFSVERGLEKRGRRGGRVTINATGF